MINSSVSSLFSGMNAKNSNTYNIYNNLSELASIKSGSYRNLVKKYYSDMEGVDKTGSTQTSKKPNRTKDTQTYGYNVSSTKKSTATAKDTTSSLAATEASAKDLKESAAKLATKGTKTLFKEIDGKYDTNQIYEAVSSFAKNYNSVIDSTSNMNSSSVVNRVKTMTDATAMNAKMLEKIGITVGSDKKLTVDETAFKKADMADVKSLFNGNGSYGYQTEVRASMINDAAKNEANKANTYTGMGAYSNNYSSGDIFSQIM